MKRKIEWVIVLCTVCFLFLMRFGFLEGPVHYVYVDVKSKTSVPQNISSSWTYRRNLENEDENETKWTGDDPAASPSQMMSSVLASSSSESSPMGAWGGLKRILERSDIDEHIKESFTEGLGAWHALLQLVEKKSRSISSGRNDDEQCPHSVGLTNAEQIAAGGPMALPCGLNVDSSITVVATVKRDSTDFKIDLVGAKTIGQPGQDSIMMHYNVRLKGDQLTDESVIIHNTWTATDGWNPQEERCPSPDLSKPSQVDGFDRCAERVGKSLNWKPPAAQESAANKWTGVSSRSDSTAKPWFPYVEGMPFAASILAGWEGFHVTVNGKHISSFPYRGGHEPWLVGEVHVQGDVSLSSMFAAGLPTSEAIAAVEDVEFLKAPPLPPKSKKLKLFIGVVSSNSNFDRRMAQRKSWMQYAAVRNGDVAVRFFVGLHNQEQVNKVLWDEAKLFGDLQLLPFVDHYHLITLKTAAICIFATEHLQAEYVMKTDDDTFVRVDEILPLLQRKAPGHSFILGEVEMDTAPQREPFQKWYISPDEWPYVKFPPWAHGPGYIITSDIAKFVSRVSDSRQLQLFKLEDVAMGIWIEEYQRSQNQSLDYVHNERFVSAGCRDDYVTAHYQNPKQMLCLWDLLLEKKAECCDHLANNF